jgi:hypothetical protein
MKDGTIVLFKTTPEFLAEKKWYERPVYKGIGVFTGKPYDHCGQKIGDDFYESGHPFGFKKSKFKLYNDERHEYHEPIDEYTTEELYRMREYWERNIRENTRYNHRKFICMIIIHPTRWFWDRLEWTPFQNNFLYGVFCSTAAYEAVEESKRTLLLYRYKETIAPGDFKDSKLLQQWSPS